MKKSLIALFMAGTLAGLSSCGTARNAAGSIKALDGEWNGEKCAPRTLILRGIAPELRLKDRDVLARAVAEGKEAERAGRYYHPTVNAALDRMSGGYSSKIQLDSLISNVRFAAKLTEAE